MQKRTKTIFLTAAFTAGLLLPAMAANVQTTLPTFPVTQTSTAIDAGNAKTKSVTLTDARQAEYEGDAFRFVIDKQSLYYQGKKGAVYRRPLADWRDDKQRQCIRQIVYPDDCYPVVTLQEQSGTIYLNHPDIGNGHRQLCYRIEQDGNCTAVDSMSSYNYSDYADFGAFQLQTKGTGQAGPCGGSMMLFQNGKQTDFGDSRYYYHIGTAHGSMPYQEQTNQVYVLAAPDTYNAPYLYAIHLATQHMERLTDKIVSDYIYADGMLYYTTIIHENPDQDFYRLHALYAKDPATGQETFLANLESDNQLDLQMAATSNGVYYRNGENGNLQFWNKHTGKTETINTGFQVTGLYSQNGYVIAHFAETAKNPHRLMVFAPSGKAMQQVYATADCSDKAVINASGLLVYRLENTNQLVQVQL